LIIGLDRAAIGTLVERSSRFTMLVHLPRETRYGLTPRTKTGPALAGYGAITMANALKQAVAKLPTHIGQSMALPRVSSRRSNTNSSRTLCCIRITKPMWSLRTSSRTGRIGSGGTPR
jgi:hypothetical protein